MKLKMMMVAGLLSLASVAMADKVCVGYDAQGNCTGWTDTGGGGYTPNIPGAPQPGDPTTPGSNCICAGYTSSGTCTYYINCEN